MQVAQITGGNGQLLLNNPTGSGCQHPTDAEYAALVDVGALGGDAADGVTSALDKSFGRVSRLSRSDNRRYLMAGTSHDARPRLRYPGRCQPTQERNR